MKFEKGRMTKQELLSHKLFEELDKELEEFGIEEVPNTPTSTRMRGKLAYAYNMKLNTGQELDMYLLGDGEMHSMLLDDNALVVEDMTPKKLAREIRRQVQRKQQQTVKVSQPQMNKLIDQLQDEDGEEIKRLEQLKQDLTKGSGRFIIINENNEFLLLSNEFGIDKTQIKVYNTKEEISTDQKIVQL